MSGEGKNATARHLPVESMTAAEKVAFLQALKESAIHRVTVWQAKMDHLAELLAEGEKQIRNAEATVAGLQSAIDGMCDKHEPLPW